MNDEFFEETISTIGVDFSMKEICVNGKSIKLQMVIKTQWDTAGEERYRAITSAYFKGLSAIIAVLDKSSQGSLDSCESYIKQAKDNADEKTVFMVMGNKSDLENVVLSEQGQELAFKFGAIYSEVSAKKNENIENSIRILATEVLSMVENRQISKT